MIPVVARTRSRVREIQPTALSVRGSSAGRAAPALPPGRARHGGARRPCRPDVRPAAAAAVSALGAPTASSSCIQLGGGNDGLNTVVPVGDHAATPRFDPPCGRVRLPPARPAGFGLHPALPKLEARYAAGKVAIVHGVGRPASDLSATSRRPRPGWPAPPGPAAPRAGSAAGSTALPDGQAGHARSRHRRHHTAAPRRSPVQGRLHRRARGHRTGRTDRRLDDPQLYDAVAATGAVHDRARGARRRDRPARAAHDRPTDSSCSRPGWATSRLAGDRSCLDLTPRPG